MTELNEEVKNFKPHITLIPGIPGVCESIWSCSLQTTYKGWAGTPKEAFGHWVSNNKKLRLAGDYEQDTRGEVR